MHQWFLQHFVAILKSGGSTAVVIEASLEVGISADRLHGLFLFFDFIK